MSYAFAAAEPSPHVARIVALCALLAFAAGVVCGHAWGQR